MRGTPSSSKARRWRGTKPLRWCWFATGAMCEAITQWIQQLQATFEQREGDNISGDYTLEFRLIGANATLGGLETRSTGAHEIGVLSIITAPTQQSANDIAKLLNPYLLHYALTPNEPMPTFAFPVFAPRNGPGRVA